MSAPVKMGVVVTQPTDFIERNPGTVAYTRDRMARDIIESGRIPDQASWKREEVPKGLYDLGPAMTTFTLDAVSEAHVIVHITKEGRSQNTEVVEVKIGTRDEAWARAKALDEERGHDQWDYHAVETAPLGYPEPDIKVTQEFRAQTTADRQRAIRMATERMRG